MSLQSYYDIAFKSLENGISVEKSNISLAISEYKKACINFRLILSKETDKRKRSLINNNILIYESKISEISGSFDEFDELDDMMNEYDNIPPPPIILPSNNNNMSMKDADKLFSMALDIDEQLNRDYDKIIDKKQYKPSIQLIHQCIDNYKNAADIYLTNPKFTKRVDGINDRIILIREKFQYLISNPTNISSPTTNISTDFSSIKSLPDLSYMAIQNDKPTNPLLTSKPKQLDLKGSAGSNNNKLSISGSLTDKEISILKSSSFINGFIFQPWLEGEEDNEKFRFDHPYCDPDGLFEMSKSQIEAGCTWLRPREFITSDNEIEELNEINKPVMMILPINPLDVVQELVSDCSFICSLCVAAVYELNTRKKLISKIIFPQKNGVPIYNAYGKYLVKLRFNGVVRKVVIDDRLPVGGINSSKKRLLCSKSLNENELWVSIIEKAYMKLNGGYDFPGSNSGIDLYVLTGWIPEHIFLTMSETKDSNNKLCNPTTNLDHRQTSERAWQRLISAHGYGDCLVTISTSKDLTKEQEESTGLVPGHAYGVLDVKEAGTLRMLKVKNPWSTRPWKGKFSASTPEDKLRWTSGLMKVLGVTMKDLDTLQTQGVFWIEYTDCLNYFKGVYFNWNPDLFSFKDTIHDFWPCNIGPKNDTYYVGLNPQYHLVVDTLINNNNNNKGKGSIGGGSNITTKRTVWVLLSRHISNKKNENQEIFIALHVHKLSLNALSNRIYTNSKPFIKGVYSNDPHTLVRIDIDNDEIGHDEDDDRTNNTSSNEQKDESFALVLSQINKSFDISYTLNVFSTSPFRIYPSFPPPPFKVELQGSWTKESSGGTTVHPSFYRNPQYSLIVLDSIQLVHIQILFPKEVDAAIFVLKTNGNRIDHINDEDIVSKSGKYRQGYCYCEEKILPGIYTIVISTYNPSQIGPFNCTISSREPKLQIKEIPAEGHKLEFNNSVVGEWSISNGTAAGCCNYKKYTENPLYLITVSPGAVQVNLTTRLQVEDGTSLPCNLSIFEIPDEIIHERNISGGVGYLSDKISTKKANFTSNDGIYSDSPCGVAILNVVLEAGTWGLIPSTFDPTESKFNISILTSKQINVKRVI